MTSEQKFQHIKTFVSKLRPVGTQQMQLKAYAQDLMDMIDDVQAEQRRKDAEIARKMDESRFYLGRGKTIADAILAQEDE